MAKAGKLKVAVVAELRPVVGAVDLVAADPGRSLPVEDVVAAPTALALVELPDSGETTEEEPVVVVASASASAAARSVAVEIEVGSSARAVRTAPRQAVLGQAVTVLAAGQSALLDLGGSVEVELVNADQWLVSCEDDALAGNANLALVGSEVIQFGQAVALAPGRFRLSRLLRGRRGTEWAMASHAVGDGFLLLEPQSLERIRISGAQTGAMVKATPRGIADSAALPLRLVVAGEALRPPSPVHLRARLDAGGNLHCSWCRRSRQGWAWLDAVDAPLGAARELYRLRLEGGGSAIEAQTVAPAATFSAAEVAKLGAGPIGLSVVQVGDLGVSRPATVSIS